MRSGNKIINMYFATHKSCNLNCRYCYIPPYNKNEQKSDDKKILDSLKNFISKVENEGYQIGAFCLHGAEPSLMEAETMAEYIKFVNEHWEKYNEKTERKVAIQTNGVRFTKEYLNDIEHILGSNDKLRIGFSIDPPKIIHDKLRNQSFDLVMNNYNEACERGFPVSILSVVSSETIKNLEGFSEWMNIQFERKKKYGNPNKIKIKFAIGELALSIEEIRYFTRFLLEHEFLNLVQILSPGYCIQRGNECDWYEFDIDGNCYSCNKVYMAEGIFANWISEPFDEIFDKRRKLYSKEYTNPECSDCEYEYLCNSGCPVDRYKSGDMAGKAHECELIKISYNELYKNGIHITDFFNNND
jgi:radical SAM protein with 4Fe4S-binding SPASM domain